MIYCCYIDKKINENRYVLGTISTDHCVENRRQIEKRRFCKNIIWELNRNSISLHYLFQGFNQNADLAEPERFRAVTASQYEFIAK